MTPICSPVYYSLVLPYVAKGASRWHPTEAKGPFSVLTCGAFDSEGEAHDWAGQNIPGHPYTVKRYDGALERPEPPVRPCAKTDGRAFLPELGDIVQGNVLRMTNSDGTVPAFSDCVIVDIRERANDPTRELHVKLARAYMYVTHVGTTCPSTLTGVETFEVSLCRLISADSLFRVVVGSRGKPSNMTH